MKKYLLFIVIIFSFLHCTPFDSNKLNKKLIQGKWEQVKIISLDDDSTYIDPEIRSSSFLYFRGDSCFEMLPDIDRNRYFRFDINSYIISLEETDHPTNFLVIAKLTEDSLIFEVDSRILKYKKAN